MFLHASDLVLSFYMYMGYHYRKPAFTVFDNVRFKPSSLKLEFFYACSKSRYDTFQYVNNKGAEQAACCSHTPQDRFSRVKANMLYIVSAFCNTTG